MCGICGLVNFNKRKPDQRQLDNLMNSISQRGRDSYGIFKEENIFLGHHRLSIIDTSPLSNQPMEFDDHILVFNGVIYNYKDLRERLTKQGHQFKTCGDTEVVLRAYLEFGSQCVEKFDGVFAFCIYDKKSKNLFLARDRIGIKPIYYTFDNSHFSFASSMLGIMKNINSLNINPKALHFQFSLHSVVPAPDTIIENIFKLEPGHTLLVTHDGKRYNNKYYDLNQISLEDHDEKDVLDNCKTLLNEAIKKRIVISDVPVGILLSGGLDSSIITAMAKNINENLNTYSIGFNSIDNEVGNEFEYSSRVSDSFSTTHYKYFMNDENLFSCLDYVIGNMSEPMFSQDSSAFNILAKNVSENQKVVLSGQGADEVFGGYFWYEQINNDDTQSDIDVFAKYYFDRNHDNYSQAFNSDFISDNFTYHHIKNIFKSMDSDLALLDKVFRLELSMLIIDDPVKRIDNMTMAHSLETRVPFLDIDLVSYLLSIKGEMKIQNQSKYYLKKISESYLDQDIIYRDKFYFPVPPLKVIKDKFYDYCKNILTSDKAISRNIYSSNYIDNLLRNPNNNFTKLNGNELWHFTLFERWLQLNIEE